MSNDFTQRLTEGFSLKPEHDIRNVHGAPGWLELSTPNPESAGKFLSTLFGCDIQRMEVGGGDYWVINVKGHSVGGIRQPAPGQPEAPEWTSYVTVADVDAIAAHASESGGEVIVPPMAIPGVGKLVGVSHPDGGRVMGFEYEHPFS